MRKILSIISIFMIMISCDNRELTENSNFGFEVETNTESEIIILQENELNIEILPVKIIENSEYTIEYKLISGEGIVLYKSQELEENEVYELSDLDNTLHFIARDLEDVELEFIVKDNFGSEQEFLISYIVKDLPFVFDLSADKTDIFEKESSKLKINIEQDSSTEISYELKLNSSSDVGDLFFENGDPVDVNTWYKIEVGETLLDFISSKPGTYEISFNVRDEFDQELEQSIEINIKGVSFNFEIKPEATEIFETEETLVNLEVSQEIEGEFEYEVKLNTISTTGELEFLDGRKIIANEWYPVNVGDNIIRLKGISEGAYELDFTLRDGTSKEPIIKREQITIKPISFTFELTSTTVLEVLETRSLKINASITPDKPNAFTYEILLQSVNDIGSFSLPNGTAIVANTWYPIEVGNTILDFKSFKPGQLNAQFVVKDSKGREQEGGIEISVQGVEFGLDLNIDKTEMFETDGTNMTLISNQNPSDVSLEYEISLKTVSDVGRVGIKDSTLYQSNQWYPYKIGRLLLEFESLKAGDYDVELEMRVKGQIERTQSIRKTINVKQTEFAMETFVRSDDPVTLPVEGSGAFESNFVVQFTPELIGLRTDLKYTIKFNSDKNGFARRCFGCESFFPNEIYSLSNTVPEVNFVERQPFLIYYVPGVAGVHNITYTIEASNGFKQEYSFSVDVYQVPVINNLLTGRLNNNLAVGYFVAFEINTDDSIGDEPRLFEIKTPSGIVFEIEYATAIRYSEDDRYLRFHSQFSGNDNDPLNLTNSTFQIRVQDKNKVFSEWTTGSFTPSFNDLN